ncbi:nuclear transport factor 2 family protein [Streptomyces sp. HNM0574]|uniref:nuclear transport factor 2 family protein n=1 Tax=Streptomyces sp. HNM0574 TaxID=2714954 RepID=UPI0032178700
MDEGRAVADAVAAEVRLADPAVRGSRESAAALLDPEFTEVGASGRRWTREEMLAGLPDLPGGSADGPRIALSGLSGTRLAPGLVHLTYEAEYAGRRSLRSSLWRRDARGAWRLYYHQGTPVPPGEDANSPENAPG